MQLYAYTRLGIRTYLRWENIFDKVRNFLGSADIKVFGCTYLFAMILLIGLTLLHTRCLVKQIITAYHKFVYTPSPICESLCTISKSKLFFILLLIVCHNMHISFNDIM